MSAWGHELSIQHPGQNSNLATAYPSSSLGKLRVGGLVIMPDVLFNSRSEDLRAAQEYRLASEPRQRERDTSNHRRDGSHPQPTRPDAVCPSVGQGRGDSAEYE